MEHMSKSRVEDLTGKRFGRLVVLSRTENNFDGRARWICKCDCGKVVSRLGRYLPVGEFNSCGCYQRDLLLQRNCKHLHAGTTIYWVWGSMIQRCNNPTNKSFKNYGGRGIKVCKRWHTFSNFLADMGVPDKGLMLERIDNDGDYEPSNCKWGTRSEQNRNTRQVILIEHAGRTQCLSDWARETGVPRKTLRSRLKNGWSFNEAIIPVR